MLVIANNKEDTRASTDQVAQVQMPPRRRNKASALQLDGTRLASLLMVIHDMLSLDVANEQPMGHLDVILPLALLLSNTASSFVTQHPFPLS